MREIKFRGKRIDNGEWIYGHYATDDVANGTIHYILEYNLTYYKQVKVVPDSIGESTGLLDKNGKEIYENDVVKIFAGTKDESLEEVLFDAGCFVVDGYVPLYVHCQDDNHNADEEVPYCEIIGNIHQHPELLKSHSENSGV